MTASLGYAIGLALAAYFLLAPIVAMIPDVN